MRKNIFFIILAFTFFSLMITSCGKKKSNKTIDEIRNTEAEFSEMSSNYGIEKAFATFADTNAVINRSDSLIVGKSAIRNFYENRVIPKNEKLTWKPDFINVSSSGDLGYTYGHYNYSFTDSSGKTIYITGVFHTVWKKNQFGRWKFVWD